MIASGWLEEVEDWGVYSPGRYPDFFPVPCAAAALARRSGFMAQTLTEREVRFLEAGLAESEPRPLYPNRFSISIGS
ncbi:MAG: hypothetical protein ACPG8W_12220 [Candidatus Promineifilaceae bacterium]